METNETLMRVAKKIEEAGGRAFLVGGSIRAMLMGLEPNDFDVEVFGLSFTELLELLNQFGKPGVHGTKFAVIKITIGGIKFDFSLPRTDSKNGVGHTDFDIVVDQNMSVLEAQSRRNFTINSGSMRIVTGEMHLNFGIEDDIKFRILRHVNEKFADDPLRVLIGMQLAGRFKLNVATDTMFMCNDLINELDTLSKERVWAEWEKMAGKSKSVFHAMSFLVETGWIMLFPELDNMRGVPQEPAHHPEGDVWVHSVLCADEMVRICDRDGVEGVDRVVAVLGALCHDMGKPKTTILEDGRWKTPAHDVVGAEIASEFLDRIGTPNHIKNRVIEIVRRHMHHVHIQKVTPRIARRFAAKLKHANLDDIARIMEADHSSRPPLPKCMPIKGKELIEQAAVEIESGKTVPILMGRHLIEMGIEPGVEMGKFLRIAEEAQMNDLFDNLEDGIEWFTNFLCS